MTKGSLYSISYISSRFLQRNSNGHRAHGKMLSDMLPGKHKSTTVKGPLHTQNGCYNHHFIKIKVNVVKNIENLESSCISREMYNDSATVEIVLVVFQTI